MLQGFIHFIIYTALRHDPEPPSSWPLMHPCAGEERRVQTRADDPDIRFIHHNLQSVDKLTTEQAVTDCTDVKICDNPYSAILFHIFSTISQFPI